MVVFTVGYEGKSLDEFIDKLVRHHVAVLADVRELPLSRKPGFSKTALAGALKERGVEYMHFRTLGTPRPLRQRLRADHDYAAFFTAYTEHLADHQEDIDELTRIAADKPVCLMCFENDPETCHRSVLASKLQAAGFDVNHL